MLLRHTPKTKFTTTTTWNAWEYSTGFCTGSDELGEYVQEKYSLESELFCTYWKTRLRHNIIIQVHLCSIGDNPKCILKRSGNKKQSVVGNSICILRITFSFKSISRIQKINQEDHRYFFVIEILPVFSIRIRLTTVLSAANQACQGKKIHFCQPIIAVETPNPQNAAIATCELDPDMMRRINEKTN